MYVKHLQPKMGLPSLCALCADGIPSIHSSLKCNPLTRNAAQHAIPSLEIASVRAVLSGAENRTPAHEITPEMRPLTQKCTIKSAKITPLHQKVRQKCDPFARKGLWAQRKPASGAILGTPWGPVLQLGGRIRRQYSTFACSYCKNAVLYAHWNWNSQTVQQFET